MLALYDVCDVMPVQNLHSTFPGSVVDPSVTNFVMYTYHTYGYVCNSIPSLRPHQHLSSPASI